MQHKNPSRTRDTNAAPSMRSAQSTHELKLPTNVSVLQDLDEYPRVNEFHVRHHLSLIQKFRQIKVEERNGNAFDM